MNSHHYIGLDVHKKSIWYCAKTGEGKQVDEGHFPATPEGIEQWCKSRPAPWTGLMEATMFSHWIYYQMARSAVQLHMGKPGAMKEMLLEKHKSDRNDARRFAELCRIGLIPAVHVISADLHPLRQQMRTRRLLQRQVVQLKNRTATLLMECGILYKSRQLHTKRYHEAMGKDPRIPLPVRGLLKMLRSTLAHLATVQKALLRGLEKSEQLKQRVQLLQSIPGVGIITALTWALEIGEVKRFSSINQVVSYCGLCSAQNESAGKNKAGPLSKVRNKELQHVLIEVGHVAPRLYWKYEELYKKTAQQHNANTAAIAVARKMVTYLMAVDRSGQPFQKQDQPTPPVQLDPARASPMSVAVAVAGPVEPR